MAYQHTNDDDRYVCSNPFCHKRFKTLGGCKSHIKLNRECRRGGHEPLPLNEWVAGLKQAAYRPPRSDHGASRQPQPIESSPLPFIPDLAHSINHIPAKEGNQEPLPYNMEGSSWFDPQQNEHIGENAHMPGQQESYMGYEGYVESGRHQGYEMEFTPDSDQFQQHLSGAQEGFMGYEEHMESGQHREDETGLGPDSAHSQDDNESVYEQGPPETWPSLMGHTRPVFGERVEWPNPWVDNQDPFGEADDMGNLGNLTDDGQDQFYAMPNGVMFEEIPPNMMSHAPPEEHLWDDLPFEPPPEILYNPYNDGFQATYARTETPGRIVYEYASAGAIIQKEGSDKTRWQGLREGHEAKYGDNIYGRWGTKREWDDAFYFGTAKASQSSLRDLLKTDRYASDPPKFGTVPKLFKTLENDMNEFGPPQMDIEEVRLGEAPLDRHFLSYMDIEKGGDYLFGHPNFDGDMAFAPIIEYGPDGVRRYSNVHTADWWNLRQRVLQAGTTLGAVVLMSDATQLSMFSGDVSAHGVYMSLANIDKSVRADLSRNAWLLVGIILKSNWEKTLASLPGLSQERRTSLVNLLNRRLFHRCMEIITRPLRKTKPHEAIDPAGNIRLVQYELAVYAADLQEQCVAAGLTYNVCPHCEANGQRLGDCHSHPPRSSQGILDNIRRVLAEFHVVHCRYPDPLEFWDAGKKYHLNGVQKPFWRKLPGVDITTLLSPDLLHGFHKLFFDHFHKWNVFSVGAEEFDTRLRAQPDVPGQRSFPQGVSHLKQLAGKDYRALQRVHLAVVANAPDETQGGHGSRKLTKATGAVMDFIFIAQLPVQTERTLAAYENAHGTYRRLKDVWIENKSKRGKKGKIIQGWAIPKQHIAGHVPDHVRWKGTLDNFNTETMEHLHGPMLKEPYRGSNRKGWIRQAIRWLARRNNMRGYQEFLMWLEAMRRAEMGEAPEPDASAMNRGERDGEKDEDEERDEDSDDEDDKDDDDEGDEDEDDEDKDEDDEDEDGEDGEDGGDGEDGRDGKDGEGEDEDENGELQGGVGFDVVGDFHGEGELEGGRAEGEQVEDEDERAEGEEPEYNEFQDESRRAGLGRVGERDYGGEVQQDLDPFSRAQGPELGEPPEPRESPEPREPMHGDGGTMWFASEHV
ncbi:hypothetical protein FRC06_000164, partial [Ceratobasidium sp. 370]